MVVSNVKRVFSALIDQVFLIVFLFIITIGATSIMGLQPSPALPFVLMEGVLFPFLAFMGLLFNLFALISGSEIVFWGDVVILPLLIGVEVLYHFIFEWILNGTPGHLCMNCRVVAENRNKLTWHGYFARSIAKTISRWFCYIPMLFIFFTPKNQSLYDILLKSVVVDAAETSTF